METRVKQDKMDAIMTKYPMALSSGAAIEIRVVKMTRDAYPYVKSTEKLTASPSLKKSYKPLWFLAKVDAAVNYLK